jgi:hypothetical protein
MDQAKNKTESVIIGNCLDCRGLVRIPATVDAKSTVRCPHCGESYPLQQILIEAVPELELVANESLSNADQKVEDEKKTEPPREKFVVPVQLSKGAKRPNRRGNRSRSMSERGESSRGETSRRRSAERPKRNEEIETTAGRVGSAKSAVARPGSPRSERTTTTPRSRSKTTIAQASTFSETTKILIGGLLAFPIAYLLVFWVFHQDPLNLGPAISRVAPFAVPANLRGPESEEAAEIDADSPIGNEAQPSSSLNGEDELDLLPIPDVDPDKIGPIEFD